MIATRRDDAELGALQEGGGDQHAVDEVVDGVADDDQRPLRPWSWAPEPSSCGSCTSQFSVWQWRQSSSFSSTKKHEDAAEDGSRGLVRVAALERVRNHFEERRAEQRADREGNQHRDPARAQRAARTAASPAESVPPAKLAARIQPSVRSWGRDSTRQPAERSREPDARPCGSWCRRADRKRSAAAPSRCKSRRRRCAPRRTSAGAGAPRHRGRAANGPRRVGENAASAAASRERNAARTSSPTSYTCGPIAGPSHASSSPAATPIASTVVFDHARGRPRHPACAAPTTVPLSSASSTGMQSAILTAQTRFLRSRVTAASASAIRNDLIGVERPVRRAPGAASAGSAGRSARSARARLARHVADGRGRHERARRRRRPVRDGSSSLVTVAAAPRAGASCRAAAARARSWSGRVRGWTQRELGGVQRLARETRAPWRVPRR